MGKKSKETSEPLRFFCSLARMAPLHELAAANSCSLLIACAAENDWKKGISPSQQGKKSCSWHFILLYFGTKWFCKKELVAQKMGKELSAGAAENFDLLRHIST